MCSGCKDGTGGEDFYEAFKNCETPAVLYADIVKRAQDETESDQWQTQILARVMCKHRVILVCEPKFRKRAEEMKLETAVSLEAAFAAAEESKGKDAHTVVIPDGVAVIVEK